MELSVSKGVLLTGCGRHSLMALMRMERVCWSSALMVDNIMVWMVLHMVYTLAFFVFFSNLEGLFPNMYQEAARIWYFEKMR